MAIRRRQLLATATAATLLGAATEDAAAAWIRGWDSQPPHRTATPGDIAGADWLAREVTALGATPTMETFPLDRVATIDAYLEIDGTRLAGEPLFDAPDTPPGGVGAMAGRAGGNAFIGIAEYGPLAVYTAEFTALRRTSQQRALVVLTHGGAPGLAMFNAESFTHPYGLPTLLLPSTDEPAILAALSRGAGFRVVTATRRIPSRAGNLVVTLPGRDRTLAPLVVMTPRSAWWQSTAERAGGLVCWLEVLRTLQANPPNRDVILTANSGHELGHIGLDAFMAARPGLITGATWLHFGANIGAAGGKLILQSPQDDLRGLAARELTAAQQPFTLAPATATPNGESRAIHRAGGRYVTFIGTNTLFHLPQDRWPDAVDLPAVTRCATAAARMAATLAQ